MTKCRSRIAETIAFVRSLYDEEGFIPLHAPVFRGREKEYLAECVDSTFVSSVGKFVDRFEEMTASFAGARHAVAVVNGTAALHTALKLVGVKPGDEVVTQPLTFIATCNAVAYCGAEPVFVDVEEETLGMSPESLESFFRDHTLPEAGKRINRHTNRPVAAVVPMHTFGHPCRIEEIARVCEEYGVPLVEDAAESLGSYRGGRHTGTFGKIGVFSYNGNKTITTGGGGMLITDDEALARRAKHLTTTAKVPHAWEYVHDEIGFNYRLPNINAALGCAQMERLEEILRDKRAVAERYRAFFAPMDGIRFLDEPEGAKSNFWLNALIFDNPKHKDLFLEETNAAGVMTRPVWRPMHELPMYAAAFRTPLPVAEYLAERIVNIPSGARERP